MKKKLSRSYHRHKHIASVIVAVCSLVAILAAVYVQAFMLKPVGTERLVTVYDRGKQQVVLTRAETVQGALNAAGIVINPEDQVEPSKGTKLDATHIDVIVYRSRMVSIVDGSIRQSVVTVAQSPNSILKSAGLRSIGPGDEASFVRGELASEGSAIVLSIKRVKKEPIKQKPRPVAFKPLANALTPSKGAQVFVDSQGVAHRETYYDLPMNVVIRACGAGNTYTVRSDGAKIDQDGYVLIAANLGSYPRCTVVETSLGPGKVYDTGGFALHHPYGFDLATDWTNYNGL